MRLAARYKAQKPDASLEEMAKAAGISGKRTTIKTYLERPEFRRILADERFLLQYQNLKNEVITDDA